MTFNVKISVYDGTYLLIDCDDFIAEEIYDRFSFYAKNYKFSPIYRNKIWDGKYHLFDKKRRLLPIGLLKHVYQYLKYEGFKIILDKSISFLRYEDVNLSFLDKYDFPFELYDHQKEAIKESLSKKRTIVLSATASGKSAIIYAVARYLQEQGLNILILISEISLVEQIYQDFIDYGWNADEYCHKVYQGQDKYTDKPITISTWQSIYKLPQSYFEKFDAVIVDEVHLASANSITSIMKKCVNTEYRLGYTGTLTESQTDEITLTAYFGKPIRVSKTKELMDKDIISKLKIKTLLLQYPDNIKKVTKKFKYHDEIKFLTTNEQRTAFIVMLASKLKNNTMVLFNLRKHGKEIYQLLKENTDKTILYVDGTIDVNKRQNIRKLAESRNDVIIVASYKTFSTGINIKNIWNIVFAHPYKSKVKNLQSIGRALRKLVGKNNAVLYDIIDDLKIGTYTNITYKHGLHRLDLYNQEEFEYSINKVDIYGK